MRSATVSILEEAKDSCPPYCSSLEYTGHPTLKLKSQSKEISTENGTDSVNGEYIWSYKMASKVQVNEEYVVYDVIGMVGTVGGTLGLFIGFSFRDIVVILIDSLEQLNIF